jgi:hypothetical protein
MAVLAAWMVLRPVANGLLAPVGVGPWVRWGIYVAGLLAIVGWFVHWLYRRSAPLRERLARGRREHPDAEVWLVALDSEWNPIAESRSTVLVADARTLLIEDVLNVPAADVVSVTTMLVTVRKHALSIVVREATWTVLVVGGRMGATGDRAVTADAAARIRAALGLSGRLEVLDHVLDRGDELPHV